MASQGLDNRTVENEDARTLEQYVNTEGAQDTFGNELRSMISWLPLSMLAFGTLMVIIGLIALNYAETMDAIKQASTIWQWGLAIALIGITAHHILPYAKTQKR